MPALTPPANIKMTELRLFWLKHLVAWENSQQQSQDYANDNNLEPRSFSRWRWNLKLIGLWDQQKGETTTQPIINSSPIEAEKSNSNKESGLPLKFQPIQIIPNHNNPPALDPLTNASKALATKSIVAIETWDCCLQFNNGMTFKWSRPPDHQELVWLFSLGGHP